MIISADIGGTKTSIGLSKEDNPIDYIKKTTYMNAEFDDFSAIVREFSDKEDIKIMVLGIAGPVSSRSVALTNLDWIIDANELESIFDCKVYLLNDLQAAAHSIPYLEDKDTELIYNTDNELVTSSNIAVIVSVGTGLGVAKIYDNGSERIIFPSEGGHIGFSPDTEFQKKLFDYLSEREEHVSCEMMISSVGFRHLREFILEEDNLGFSKDFMSKLEKTIDFPRLLLKTSTEVSKDSKICSNLIDEFSLMLGGYLGDMVLIHLPHSIYFTGGIGRNIPRNEILKQRYLEKANMSHIPKSTNLMLISDPDCALHGTSWFASEHL